MIEPVRYAQYVTIIQSIVNSSRKYRLYTSHIASLRKGPAMRDNVQFIIDQGFWEFPKTRQKSRQLEGPDGSPEFLKTGTTGDDFQQAGKPEAVKHLLSSLERTDASSRAHFLITTEMPSGPRLVNGKQCCNISINCLKQQQTKFGFLSLFSNIKQEFRLIHEKNIGV